MAAATHNVADELAEITPVVLVGGRSRRFGRDKLREPIASAAAGGDAGGWLVDRPVAALREVFGPRVAALGACDPEVAARFDRIIKDCHPGAGPIGGIISALAAAGGPVFVLAGDLAAVTAEEVRAVVEVWVQSSGRPSPAGCKPAPPGAGAAPLLAIMACTDRPEPCCALYTPEALAILQARLARGERRLHDALRADRVELVPVPRERLANINTPGDMIAGRREV